MWSSTNYAIAKIIILMAHSLRETKSCLNEEVELKNTHYAYTQRLSILLCATTWYCAMVFTRGVGRILGDTRAV